MAEKDEEVKSSLAVYVVEQSAYESPWPLLSPEIEKEVVGGKSSDVELKETGTTEKPSESGAFTHCEHKETKSSEEPKVTKEDDGSHVQEQKVKEIERKESEKCSNNDPCIAIAETKASEKHNDSEAPSDLDCKKTKTDVESNELKQNDRSEIQEQNEREPSELLRNIIFDVSFVTPVDETVAIGTKNTSANPVQAVPSMPTNMKESELESKKPDPDSITDEFQELQIPLPIKKSRSEWVPTNNSWNNGDYLRIELKKIKGSESSMRGKELERKTSIGPCYMGSAQERPSGISISIPMKSMKNIDNCVSRPIKTGISFNKKSTIESSRAGGDEHKKIWAPAFLTYSPTLSASIVCKEPMSSSLDIALRVKATKQGSKDTQAEGGNKFFSGFCGKVGQLCDRFKTLF